MDIKEKRKKINIPVGHKRAKKVSPFLISWNSEKFQEHETEEHAERFDELFHKSMSWIDDHADALHNPISIHTWHIVVFTVLVIFITVPMAISAYANTIEMEKGELQQTLSQSVVLFQTGVREAQDGNALHARNSFAEAHTLFTEAELSLRGNHPFVSAAANIAPRQIPKWSSVHNALEAGRLASKAGVIVSDALHLIQEKNTHLTEQEVAALLDVTGEVEDIVAHIHTLVDDIDPTIVPEEDRQLVFTLQNALPGIEAKVHEAIDIIHFSAALLGYTEGKKKILVMFQNNAELRATGGFMGSYAMIEMDSGEVSLIDVPPGGTYDFQGTVRKAYASPEPLHLVNPVWQFQDANWWPDWQASAGKIAWFYEQGNGATVDYVMSLTPTVLEEFLRVTGPVTIDTPDGLSVIDHKNVYNTLQARPQEVIPDAPKKIIGDTLSAVFERVQGLSAEEISGLIPLVQSSLKEKHMLLYAKDAAAKNVISEHSWGGDVESTAGDYVLAVHTNIAGGKSDRDIKDRVRMKSHAASDGTITNTVTLTRTHHGRDGVGFGGVRNVDFVRLYVPRDATLLNVTGYNKPSEELFEKVPDGFAADPDIERYETVIDTDERTGTTIMRSFGKTVFANWLMVDPGTSASLTFTYTLPFTITDNEHSILAAKQAGLDGVVFEYEFSSDIHTIEGVHDTTLSFTEVMTEDIERDISFITQ